jgi:hypothetical protein
MTMKNNPPRPYDVMNLKDLKRLYRELLGYMKVSFCDGTDRAGRLYAIKALEELCRMAEEDTP